MYEKEEGSRTAVRASLPEEGVIMSQGKKSPRQAVRTTENSVTTQQQLSHAGQEPQPDNSDGDLKLLRR